MKKKITCLGLVSILLLSSSPLTVLGETNEPIKSSNTTRTTNEVGVSDGSIELKQSSMPPLHSGVENSSESPERSLLTSDVSSEQTEVSVPIAPADSSESARSEPEIDKNYSGESLQEPTEIDEIYTFDEEGMYPNNRSEVEGEPQKNRTSNFRLFARVLTNPPVKATDVKTPKKSFVDISSWNEKLKTKDFLIMKKYGVTGVVVKLTEGTTYRNPAAPTQVKEALAAGMKVSAYHFSHFKDLNTAKQEADFFAQVASELSLSKDTLMVNDIETKELLGNQYNTVNSIAFEKRLNDLGFAHVNHYTGLNWIREKRIDPTVIGLKKMWVAQYLFETTDINHHQAYGAWQWSDKMTFPGVAGTFDISADYSSIYSEIPEPTPTVAPKEGPGDFHAEQSYVILRKGNTSMFEDFAWKEKDNTSNYLGTVLKSSGYYIHSNGTKYLSVYDKEGNFRGFVDSQATEKSTNATSGYISFNKYVVIDQKEYTIWGNFSWKHRTNSGNFYGKPLLAKGYYNHFNGNRYLSLYDHTDNWIGYLDEKATKPSEGRNGFYQSYWKYVSIKSRNYTIWQNFYWKGRDKSANYYGKPLLAKGFYEHANGERYLSLYDQSGKWIGYINENATTLSSGKVGFYQSYRKNVLIKSKNYPIWRNFNWRQIDQSSNYYRQTLFARGYYDHYNGSRYLSLYDKSGRWIGYVNEKATSLR